MALPNGGGGYQIGDGNVNEPLMFVQPNNVNYDVSSTLTAADIASAEIIKSFSATAITYTMPTPASVDAFVPSARVNSAFDFYVISSGAGTTTVAVGTGWTLVGAGAVGGYLSGHFRARKTGDAAWTLYRLS